MVGLDSMKREWINLSYTIPGRGLRLIKAEIRKGGIPSKTTIIYPKSDDPCSERGFVLYQDRRSDELKLRIVSTSKRRLRRFCRDFTRFSGGGVWSENHWVVPWR